MSGGNNAGLQPVRLLFEMTREDNPRLYDDLIRFNKGTKRVNRLRYLAHEGLLAQSWAMVPVAPGRNPEFAPRGPDRTNSTEAAQVIRAFDSPGRGLEN